MTEQEYKELKETLWRTFRKTSQYANKVGESNSYQVNHSRASASQAASELASQIIALEDFWSKYKLRNKR